MKPHSVGVAGEGERHQKTTMVSVGAAGLLRNVQDVVGRADAGNGNVDGRRRMTDLTLVRTGPVIGTTGCAQQPHRTHNGGQLPSGRLSENDVHVSGDTNAIAPEASANNSNRTATGAVASRSCTHVTNLSRNAQTVPTTVSFVHQEKA